MAATEKPQLNLDFDNELDALTALFVVNQEWEAIDRQYDAIKAERKRVENIRAQVITLACHYTQRRREQLSMFEEMNNMPTWLRKNQDPDKGPDNSTPPGPDGPAAPL